MTFGIQYVLWISSISCAVGAHDPVGIDQSFLAEIPELGDETAGQVGTEPALIVSSVDEAAQGSNGKVTVTDIIGTAVDVAVKAGKIDNLTVDKIVKSVQTNLDALAPKAVEWPEKASDRDTFFPLAPAPSPENIKYLEKQAAASTKYRQRLQSEAQEKVVVPEKCEGCKKYYDRKYANLELPQLKKKAAEAEKKLKDAEAWAALEKKRDDELPGLVKALQVQSQHEHEMTVKAEKKAMETKIARIALERLNEAKLAAYRKEIAKQRFIERLRAAEDAKVAGCALKASLEKSRKLKLKAKTSGAQLTEAISKPSGTLRLKAPSSSPKSEHVAPPAASPASSSAPGRRQAEVSWDAAPASTSAIH